MLLRLGNVFLDASAVFMISLQKAAPEDGAIITVTFNRRWYQVRRMAMQHWFETHYEAETWMNRIEEKLNEG